MTRSHPSYKDLRIPIVLGDWVWCLRIPRFATTVPLSVLVMHNSALIMVLSGFHQVVLHRSNPYLLSELRVVRAIYKIRNNIDYGEVWLSLSRSLCTCTFYVNLKRMSKYYPKFSLLFVNTCKYNLFRGASNVFYCGNMEFLHVCISIMHEHFCCCQNTF